MAKVNGSFTVEIPKTADLTPPTLECTWEAEVDGAEPYDKVLLDYFKKNYGDGLKKVMSEQAKHFSVPLASMQKEIDEMKKANEYIKNEPNAVKVMEAMVAFQKKYPDPLDKKVKDYNDYLVKAVENVKKQQVLAWGSKFEAEALAAAQKAVKTAVRNKKFRHIAGVVLKGVLVLAVAAAAIAATVLTFGSAGVVFASIAAASAGLGGFSAIVNTGRAVAGIWDLEKRSLELLAKDVKFVGDALKGAEPAVNGLAKHVNDVSAYYTQRKAKTESTRAELAKMSAILVDLRSKGAGFRSTLPKVAAAHEASVAKAHAEYDKVKAALEASIKRDEAIKKVLDDATAVIGDLQKIPFQKTKGLADGVTRIDLKDAGTWMDGVDKLGGILGAIGGVGTAKTPIPS